MTQSQRRARREFRKQRGEAVYNILKALYRTDPWTKAGKRALNRMRDLYGAGTVAAVLANDTRGAYRAWVLDMGL